MGSVRLVLLAAILAMTADIAAQDIDWVTFPAAYRECDVVKGRPFKFANNHKTDLNLSNSGSFECYSDGSISWTLGVCSESSRNINVMLSGVSLGPSDQLNIYSPDSSFFQSYTFRDIPESGVVQSLPIKGDSLIISLLAYGVHDSYMRVSNVNCGFLDLPEHSNSYKGYLKASAGSYGSSESCEVDVTCDETFADVKQSVCRLLINGNSYGSGVLINNTSHDGKPYVLTAAHVIYDNEVNSCWALFNYETPYCQNIEPASSSIEKIQGAKLIAINPLRDLALLQLSSAPSAESRPYWSGWNISTDVSNMDRFYTIHHPYGDVRKVSTGEAVMAHSTYTYDKTNDGEDFDAENHWRVVQWIAGTTEGGSSGGGLFDSNLRVIGNLSGGLASCKDQRSDYFWMLANNWDVLKQYLDPVDSGVMYMDGEYLSSATYSVDYSADKDVPVLKLRPSDKRGYIAGHNLYQTTKISQLMGQEGSETSIQGVYLSPFVARSVHKQSFIITLWSDKDGVPDNVIASQTVDNNILSAKKVSYHAFTDGPHLVKGRYHVGVEISYDQAAVDTLAFYCQEGSGALFFADNKWQKATEFGSETDLSLFVGVRCVKSTGTPTTTTTIDEISLKRILGNTYDISGSLIKVVRIYNINGICIGNYTIDNNIATINLDNRPSGIYIIKVETSDGCQTFKTLKR